MKKSRKILTTFLCGLAAVCVSTGVLCGVLLGKGEGKDPLVNVAYSNDYQTKTKVGFEEEVLGEVKRGKPEIKDGRLETGYPKYGETLKMDESQRSELIKENLLYCGVATTNTGGTFDKMDEWGNLYLNGKVLTEKDGSYRKLFKHTASIGMYGGDVAENEPAISKKLTYKKRGYSGYGVTGMYAPAGEIIKVKIYKDDMDATNGITIHIGQALYNGQANNIWSARDMNRMPVILNTMEVNKDTATLGSDGYYTAYVGSFFGGPIYVRNEDVTFSVIISGGVRYSHFILGYTTPEEFEINSRSSAPYFDLEVWENGVLHSGPKQYAEGFTYDDLYKVAVYWDKVALVSTKVSSNGVVFMYDPFVAAGAAVAFPGRCSVNCPDSWMRASLNYEGLVTTGAWGNMHEYNHNFQSGWGRGDGGEVTNNALNLVEYSLFTKISSARQIDNYGAAGLSDWNRYTSATWAINQALLPNRENDLSQYAAILHSFGQDMFIKAIERQKSQRYNTTVSGWAKALSEVTHYDMRYFLGSIVYKNAIDAETDAYIEKLGYPKFVPVASVYQTGRSFKYNGEDVYITTQKPYQIPYGRDFNVDLRPYTAQGGCHVFGSVILPSDYNFEIAYVNTDNLNGTLQQTETNGVYKFTPNNQKNSGKIIVTLKLISSSNEESYVDLVLEFEQTRGLNKNVVERTTYYYEDGKGYKSATEAYQNEYAGFYKKDEGNNINTVQNGNAELWYTEDEFKYETTNKVVEIKGKMYVEETAKYRMAIRGRYNVALYISINSEDDFDLAATYTDNTAADFRFSNKEETYVDLELNAGDWVYFKEVMISERLYGKPISFVGLGWGKFTPPVPEFDAKGNVIGEKTTESVQVAYASAYRNEYELEYTDFETPYFYTNEYKFSFSDRPVKSKVIDSNYRPWTDDTAEKFDLSHVADGDPTTNIHSKQGVENYISETNPFHLTFDLGSERKINKITIGTYTEGKSHGNMGMPTDFVFSGSLDNQTYFEICSFVGKDYSGNKMVLTFEDTKLRYVKITVTKTDNGRYFATNGIDFDLDIIDTTQIAPDDKMLSYTGGWTLKGGLSSFGHVLIGKKDYVLKFSFTGTLLGVLSSNSYQNNFDVYIDGEKVESKLEPLKAREYVITYFNNALKDKTHHVEIRCTGQASIDSIFVK